MLVAHTAAVTIELHYGFVKHRTHATTSSFQLARMTHFGSLGLRLTHEAQQRPESYVSPNREVG
jgi:hypothetical protein